MKITRHAPSSPLRPFVRSIMVQECDGDWGKNLLPVTSVVLTFRVRGGQVLRRGEWRNALPRSGVSGLRTSARTIEYAKGTLAVVVLLREGGAFGLLRAPIHELFDVNASIGDLIDPGAVALVEDRLAAAQTDAERVAVVEGFLLEALGDYRIDPLIGRSIRLITAHQGRLRIGELVDRLPIGIDSFEKRFRRLVGTTPKHFSSIVRLRSLIDRHAKRSTLVDAALAAGYYDQSHFAREFKGFTGRTPREYFRAANSD